MTLRELLYGLGTGQRLDVFTALVGLGIADRRMILRALGLDDNPLSPPWQQIKRCLVWLCTAGLVNESRSGPGKRIFYSADLEQWNKLIERMDNLT